MVDMQHRLRTHLALVGFGVLLALPVHAQNFSCRIGTQPACLDYGDKVCSSMGKCVDNSSACFDEYQCNYEGFTCKSNVTECVEDHDRLVEKYNSLLSDNNDLIDSYNALLSRNSELVTSHNDLLDDAKKLAMKYDDLNDCLTYANTMDDVQSCVLYR